MNADADDPIAEFAFFYARIATRLANELVGGGLLVLWSGSECFSHLRLFIVSCATFVKANLSCFTIPRSMLSQIGFGCGVIADSILLTSQFPSDLGARGCPKSQCPSHQIASGGLTLSAAFGRARLSYFWVGLRCWERNRSISATKCGSHCGLPHWPWAQPLMTTSCCGTVSSSIFSRMVM